MKVTARFSTSFVLVLLLFFSMAEHQTASAQSAEQSADTTATAVTDTLTVVVETDDSKESSGTESDTASVSSGESDGNKDNGIKDQPVKSIAEIISISKLVWALFVLVVTFYGVRLIVSILDNLAERYPSKRLFIKRLVPALRIVLWSIAIYFVIEGIFDPPAETVYAMLASIGIAVGFASQDILRNVFGGFMIILDRPFQVGDKVDVGGHYGEVTQIGLRSVRLVTPDDSVVSVPNGELMNKSVSNTNSGALDCQVVAEVYLPQNTDPQWVREVAYKVAATSKYVYLNKPVAVIIKNEIAGSRKVMKIRIKAYVIDIRFEFPFMSEMTEIFLKECAKKNILEN